MAVSFIPGSEVVHRIKNFIHKDTQTGGDKVYLTVKQIYFLDEKGSLDFGGSELNLAERKPLLPKKRLPEDKYGWWNLNQGIYLVEFNEQIELREKERDSYPRIPGRTSTERLFSPSSDYNA